MATARATAGGPESTARSSSQRLSRSGTSRSPAAYARSRTVVHDNPCRVASAVSRVTSRQTVNCGIAADGVMVRATAARIAALRSRPPVGFGAAALRSG